jgi:hypothetical protein
MPSMPMTDQQVKDQTLLYRYKRNKRSIIGDVNTAMRFQWWIDYHAGRNTIELNIDGEIVQSDSAKPMTHMKQTVRLRIVRAR